MRALDLTTIDEADVPLLSGRNWYVTANGYVAAMEVRNGKRCCVLLHRLLTGAPDGTVVDHIDGNTLNNSRANLRVTDQTRNQANRKRLNKNNASGLRGVQWIAKRRRWRAQITAARKNIHLGMFHTIEAAYAARKVAEMEHWGEYAP